MCTYFAVAKPYKNLTNDGDVETEPFLEACKGIVEFIGFFGKAFVPIKNDVDGNVQKIRNKYQTNPGEYCTLKILVEKEIAHQEKIGDSNMGSATESLLWLKRGLEYFLTLMELIIHNHKTGVKEESLVLVCTTAYERTLKRHHNILAKGLFKLAVQATPWKKDLMKLLAYGVDNMETQVVDDLEIYVRHMKVNVDCICEFYVEKNLESLLENVNRNKNDG